MKQFLATLLLISFSLGIMAQGIDTIRKEEGKINMQPKENQLQKDSTIKTQKGSSSEQKNDTTKIKLGNKGISIFDDGKGTSIRVENLDQKDNANEEAKSKGNMSEKDEEKDQKQKHVKFKGHWSAFELGMNNFVNKNFSMVRNGQDQFMDLNSGKSWNVNLNIIQHTFGFGTDIAGLVTGLGLEFNDYRFDGNNNIKKDTMGVIVSNPYKNLQKSKISTCYLTLPLLIEFQFPHSARASQRMHISAGIIGGLKLGSHTKVVYYDDKGKEQTDKVRDDFNINALRYGFTGRIGYNNLSIFANYYATSFFEKGKGPELFPFSIGLALNL